MFAVIKTGGKQYKVQEGEVLQVEKLNLEEGQEVSFDQVLLIDHEDNTLIGTPFVENALVKAVVVKNFKDKNIIVFKKKRRKQYKKKRGHRQDLTEIKIEKIISKAEAVSTKKPTPETKIEKKKTDEKKAMPVIKAEPVKEEKTKTAAPEAKTETAKTKKPKTTSPVKKKTTTKASASAKKTTKTKE